MRPLDENVKEMTNEESMDSNLDSDSITTDIACDKEYAIVYEKVKNKY
jgi:hypothetical protein